MAVSGFVDGIRDGIGYVTLIEDGESYWAEIPAAQLEAAGIRERRRFIVHDDTLVAVPDVEITAEREAELWAAIDELLGPHD